MDVTGNPSPKSPSFKITETSKFIYKNWGVNPENPS